MILGEDWLCCFLVVKIGVVAIFCLWSRSVYIYWYMVGGVVIFTWLIPRCWGQMYPLYPVGRFQKYPADPNIEITWVIVKWHKGEMHFSGEISPIQKRQRLVNHDLTCDFFLCIVILCHRIPHLDCWFKGQLGVPLRVYPWYLADVL